jgi:hypothetical protein
MSLIQTPCLFPSNLFSLLHSQITAGRQRSLGSTPVEVRHLSSSVHTGSKDHPACHSMGTGDALSGGKAVDVQSSPLTSK